MPGAHAQQISNLLSAVSASGMTHGEARVNACEAAVRQLLYWLNYLQASERTGCCDEILKGVRAAAVEATGGIALGLLRLAIFAMRGQIDLSLAWLFFKDHPVEWGRVLNTGEGFMLKQDIFDYLSGYHDSFPKRMSVLEKYKSRSVSDPYKLLSAHIHSQSTLVMPTFAELKSMVYSEQQCEEAIRLQGDVVEYINDLFLSFFGSKWASLPTSITDSAKARVPPEDQPILFS